VDKRGSKPFKEVTYSSGRKEASKLISSLREGTELGVDPLLVCGRGEILDNAR
jgi:hypothetical protein